MAIYKVRDANGNTFEVDEEKAHKAEADGYLPVVSNGKEEHRVSFNDLPRAMEDGYQPLQSVSQVESAVRGLAQGLSFGLADELSGALESTFTDKTYEQARDESRRNFDAAQKANPITYNVGDIGGSVATAFIPGLGALNAGKGARLAEVAGKAALQGGLTGLGKSDEDSAAGIVKDTAIGAGLGGALGGAGYGVAKGVGKAVDTWDNIGGLSGVKQASQAFREGAKEGKELGGVDISNLPGISQFSQAYQGGKRALSEIGELASTKKELSNTLQAIQETFGPGASADLSNEAKLMQKLLEEGPAGMPNQAMEHVANTFAQVHGGDARTYLELIKRSGDDLAAAQKFNPIEAGEELAPAAQLAFDDVRAASGKQYNDLKEIARANFTKQDSAPVRIVSSAIEDATKYESISGNTRAVLKDTFNDLAGREGQASFTELAPQDQFDRVLAAKQRLGKAVKWAAKNELPEGQKILQDTYVKFQGMLQKLDDMKAADKGYAGFKSIENNLFKKLGKVERGQIKEFDPIKLEALFSGSRTGRSLVKQVEKARQMLEQGLLQPEQAASVQSFLNKIDEMGKKASLKRDLTNFRYKDAGPSSPAIQREAAIAGKDSPVVSASKAPQLFLNIKAQVAESAKQNFGRPFDQLSQREKEIVSQFAMWSASNPTASLNAKANKFNELMNRKK